MVLVASAVVALVVWWVVTLAVALLAFALWRLGRALHALRSGRLRRRASGRRRVYRPGAKA
jgi:hypothetical protein